MRLHLRLAVAGALGLAAALLVACGGSGKGLIPAAQAGPLQSDFEAVAQAAEAGNGDCAATETALGKTEKDFLALPAGVNSGLRSRLREGIANLRTRALAMCAQPAATVTTTATSTTPAETTPTPTTPTATTPAPTPTSPSDEGGGTEAPEEEGEVQGKGKGRGKGVGKEGDRSGEAESEEATSAGGASPGEGQ